MKFIIGIITLLLSAQGWADGHSTHHKGHGHPNAEKNLPRQAYQGLEDFETLESYVIVFKSDQGRKAMAKQKEAEAKGAPKKTRRDKRTSVKNEYYLKLADIFPAGLIFSVDMIVDDDNGDLEVHLSSNVSINPENVINRSEILSFERKPNFRLPKTIYVEPDSTTLSIDIPEGWTKEKGYREILKLLDQGNKTIKVSAVFDNPDNSRFYASAKPFNKIVNQLIQKRKCQPYGYGYTDNYLAWWTQDIDREQLQWLFEHDLVVNLIPRTN